MTLPAQDIVERLLAAMDGVTPGSWQVLSQDHPWTIPANPERGRPEEKHGNHTERRVYTVAHHPQLKGPYPIIEIGIGITNEPGQSVHMVSISAENAAYIALCSPDNIGALLATISRLTADNEALRKTNEHWRRQSRDGFEAFSAMRDAINEVVPMQSAEADLLDGPELFVSCEAVALAVVSRVTALEAENKVLREDQNALDKLLQLMGIADSDCAPDEVLQGILEAFDRLSAWNADFLHHDQWEIIAGALGRWNKGERADDYTLGIIDFGFKRLVEAKLSFAAALGGPDHG